jgi:hypothetical protein
VREELRDWRFDPIVRTAGLKAGLFGFSVSHASQRRARLTELKTWPPRVGVEVSTYPKLHRKLELTFPARKNSCPIVLNPPGR